MSKHTTSKKINQITLSDLDDLQEQIESSSVFGGGSVPSDRTGGAPSEKKGRTLISCPFQTVLHGLDTLHLTFDIDNKNGHLIQRMIDAKKVLQSSSEAEGVFRFNENGSDVFSWNIQRTGTKLYPYVFRTGDLILCMSSRSSGSAFPAMALMVGSLTCNQDPMKMLKDFKFWMELLNIRIIKQKVSRVDIFMDIIHDIKKGYIEKVNHFVTRARDTHVFYSHRKFTGIQWGSGDVVCRIYDKQLQMKQQQQAEKSVFFNYIWQTNTDIPVTRVEFQLRRAALREFFNQEVTPQVVYDRAGDLWQYLTNDWLRHTAKSVVKNNEHSSPLSFFWFSIQTSWKKFRFAVSRNRRQKHINIPALRKQASGILLTIAAAIGHESNSFFNIIGTLTNIISEDILAAMSDTGFADKFLSKQSRALCCF